MRFSVYLAQCLMSCKSSPNKCELLTGSPNCSSFLRVWSAGSVVPSSLSLCGLRPARLLSPCPPPGDLPDPGIEPGSSYVSCTGSWWFTTSTAWEAPSFLSGLHFLHSFSALSPFQKHVDFLLTGEHFLGLLPLFNTTLSIPVDRSS